MDYAVSNDPGLTPLPGNPVASRREPVVRSAMERLEKLATESDELVERLQSTFSLVLFHRPQNGESTLERDVVIPGSDLGQALMRLAERIDGNFRAIRGVIESADV